MLESFDEKEEDWLNFLNHPHADTEVPEPWKVGNDISVTNPVAAVLKKMMIVKTLRPDRLLASVATFVQGVLGEEIVNVAPVELNEFVNEGVTAKSPLLLVSAPGFDASYKVDMLAKQANKKYISVAIGSPEAFGLVDTAIRNAAKSGNWVLLKNVHLAP